MSSLNDYLAGRLADREAQGLLRTLSTTRLPIDFFSNDYLGLARSADLAREIAACHHNLGVQNGSAGSRLLGGNTPFTEAVEQQLSEVFRSEATLLFNSGYSANLAVLSSVPQRGDTILYDALAHASIKDGARLSLATRHSFRHNDMNDLEQKLQVSGGRKFIVVESIYSMDGDTCPLDAIVGLAGRYDAAIILDEAHSTGIIGPDGAGFAVDRNLHDKINIRIYTFGKGMGIHGACVAGSRTLAKYLVNFARPFIYTTAPSQHQVVSIQCAFDHLKKNLHLQKLLQNKIGLYRETAGEIASRNSDVSAIQTVRCPGNVAARQFADALRRDGFDVRAILSPTVPAGTERLRICLHVFNSDAEITALTGTLRSLNNF